MLINNKRQIITQQIIVFFAIIFFTNQLVLADENHDQHDILQSASELDYPPFAIVRPDGTADGFSVELLKAVVNAADLEINISVGPWHEIKQALAEGHLDVLPLVAYSKNRDKIYDFTVPYLQMHGTIFVRKGEKSIRSELDLKGKAVLVMRGDSSQEYAISNNLSNNLILTENFESAFNLLSSGKHDAILCQYLVGLQLIKKLDIENVISVSTIHEKSIKPRSNKVSGFEQKFCIAVPEGEKELLAHLNEGLTIVIANGTYAKLYDKWFSPILPVPVVPLAVIVKTVLIYLIPIILLFTFGGILYLRQEVCRKTANLKAEIQERTVTQKKLIQSEERFRLHYENAPMPYQSLNYEGLFLDVNPAWLETLGYSKDEVIGKSFGDFLLPDMKEHFKYNFPRFKDKGEIIGVEFEMVKKDGSVIMARFNGKIGYDEEGNFKQTHCIFQDVTEIKKSEKEKESLAERLSQAQKMEAIGTLAGGIAHDFNNILGVILGYVDMAKDDAPPGTRFKKDLEKVSIAANRAKDLVKQILAFSRQTQVECIPIQIQPLIKEGLKMLRSSIPTTISITEDIDPKSGVILADPTQIHQILMNLCTNAYQSMEECGGELSVSLKTTIIGTDQHEILNISPGEYVQLSVSDTGAGIGPDLIDKVFDPYFTTKEIGKGTGMGLAIIHGIMQDYGGSITVESQLGKGATFYVYFPVVEKDAIPEIIEPEDIPIGKERVLFIDDEKLLAEMGKDMLERLGYHVTVRRNSIEALSTFQNTPDEFDVIITDQTMPDMTGSDLARRMMQIRPDVPIILCTGYSNLIDEDSAKALGIKEFALKPLTKEVISKLIRKVLDTA